MKLLISKYVGALALQFIAAPHYVSFSHEVGDITVNFQTGCGASFSSCTSSQGEKKTKKTVVDITVPAGPGLNDIFGGQLKTDAQALEVGKAIRAAVDAFNESQAADASVELL